MPDQPYTIRDGDFYDGDGGDEWEVCASSLPVAAWDGMPTPVPCLVVTGDLDAARRRLAPLPADTRTAAVIRPAHDDAALRAAADALDNAAALLLDWAEYAPDWARDRHDFAADLATVHAAAAMARAALVAAGLIRPAHDDAAYVAMREEFIRIIDDADSCIHAQPSKESLATTLVRAARSALAAAEERDDA